MPALRRSRAVSAGLWPRLPGGACGSATTGSNPGSSVGFVAVPETSLTKPPESCIPVYVTLNAPELSAEGVETLSPPWTIVISSNEPSGPVMPRLLNATRGLYGANSVVSHRMRQRVVASTTHSAVEPGRCTAPPGW